MTINIASNKEQSVSTKSKHATHGFGVPVIIAPHHFIVTIPRDYSEPVQVIEDLGMRGEVTDRAIVLYKNWNKIAEPVKRVFNKRLKEHNLSTSQWKVGNNYVDRLLGKELCVLLWAIEEIESKRINAALRSWLSLRQEERWWLFSMASSKKGWRLALKHALGDLE